MDLSVPVVGSVHLQTRIPRYPSVQTEGLRTLRYTVSVNAGLGVPPRQPLTPCQETLTSKLLWAEEGGDASRPAARKASNAAVRSGAILAAP
jgi:hypothetical protein